MTATPDRQASDAGARRPSLKSFLTALEWLAGADGDDADRRACREVAKWLRAQAIAGDERKRAESARPKREASMAEAASRATHDRSGG